MELRTLSVTNYRAIKSETFTFYNYTTLIGPNNCGKSTVLRAIQLLLNQEKPTPEEWNDSKNAEVRIEAAFVDISEEERKIPGIAGLVFDNQIQIRATYIKTDDVVELSTQAYMQEEDINGWSTKWKDLSPEIRALAEAVGVSSNDDWKKKGTQEKVRAEIRQKRPDLIQKGDVSWTDEGISIPEALRQGLPRVLVIPAVRDASEESRIIQRKNIFREIFENDIIPDIEATEEYQAIRTGATKLKERLSASAVDLKKTSSTAKDLSDAASAIVDLALSFAIEVPDAERVFGSSAELVVADGKIRTSVELQGHGAQRSIIFALIEYVARRGDLKKQGKDSRPVILLFEEPELYIHPQMLRALKRAMKRIAARKGWQVIATTHSPIMVDVAETPQSLIIMRRDASGLLMKKQLTEDPFLGDEEKRDEKRVLRAVLDFHPTVCEAFFAQNTVLVEGDSEIAILSCYEEVCAARGQAPGRVTTTVISCGGKWTIIPIARLLREYQIPFKVVHDLDTSDAAADDGDDDEKKNSAIAANSRIEALVLKEDLFQIDSTLEDILYEKKGTRYKTDKPVRAWRRLRAITKTKGDIEKYSRLIQLFDFVYPGDKAAMNAGPVGNK